MDRNCDLTHISIKLLEAILVAKCKAIVAEYRNNKYPFTLK